jgi:hypothetical protein
MMALHEAAQTRQIPLGETLTTSAQEGLQNVGDAFSDPDNPEVKSANGYLQKILRSSENGASNVFLVDATSAVDAVRSSAGVLLRSRAADSPAPVNMGRPKRGAHWLVAYLGTAQCFPVRWNVEGVAVEGNRIRLAYHTPDSTVHAVTTDVHAYLYWVPLSELAPGVYQLELFDAGEEAVTLMRRVRVEDISADRADVRR